MMRTFFSSALIVTAAGVACGGKISANMTDDTAAASTDDMQNATGDEADTNEGAVQDDADTGSVGASGDADTGSDTDDTDEGDDGGSAVLVPGGGSDVSDFQRASLSEGTPVTLNNVVVSSTMSIEAPGFYVQDVGGGEWSGVFVYTQAIETAAGLPDDAAFTVNVGDVLNLSGTSKEHWDETQLVLESIDDVERIGTSAEVTTTTLDAPPTDWEPYEGVLISIADVEITRVPEPDDGSREAAPVTNWDLSVADKLMEIEMEAGDSFSSITGIVTYSWDLYRIAPRTSADLAD